MADLSNAKFPVGSTYPTGSVQAVFRTTEPLLGPQELRERFLFGINLVSPQIDPSTKAGYIFKDELLDDTIQRAVSSLEGLTNLSIFPQKIVEKKPWDKQLWDSYGFLKLDMRPCSAVMKVSIRPANGQDVFVFPQDWVETAYLPRGELTFVPINVAAITGGQVVQSSNAGGGSFFINHIASRGWVPAYWCIEYIVGFADGNVPAIINEAVGMSAAIDILSMLAAAHADYTSTSTGLDGASQSRSGPGPQKYDKRIERLEQDLERTLKRLKVMFGNTMFVSNV